LANWQQLLEGQEAAAAVVVAERAVQELIGEEKEAVMAEVEAVARRLLRPWGIRDSARGRGEKRSRCGRTSSRRTSRKSRNNSSRM
jgi:hypothetical protein